MEESNFDTIISIPTMEYDLKRDINYSSIKVTIEKDHLNRSFICIYTKKTIFKETIIDGELSAIDTMFNCEQISIVENLISNILRSIIGCIDEKNIDIIKLNK